MSNVLTDQYIDDTYTGILHASGEELPESGQKNIYDGSGNRSALSLGRDGEGATVTAPFKIGSLQYPSENGVIGAYVVQSAPGLLELKSGSSVFGDIINHLYPLNSIFLSFDNVNPGVRFAGTIWEQVSNGRFLAGVGEGTDGMTSKNVVAGDNSGEYSHTLTVDELPTHRHDLKHPDTNEQFYVTNDRNDSGGGANTFRADGPSNDNDGRYYPYTNYVGNSSSHNNTPPGFGVYVWKRIA